MRLVNIWAKSPGGSWTLAKNVCQLAEDSVGITPLGKRFCAADGTPMLIAMTLLPSQRAIIAVSQRYGSGIIPPVPSKQISNINRLTSFHLMLIS